MMHAFGLIMMIIFLLDFRIILYLNENCLFGFGFLNFLFYLFVQTIYSHTLSTLEVPVRCFILEIWIVYSALISIMKLLEGIVSMIHFYLLLFSSVLGLQILLVPICCWSLIGIMTSSLHDLSGTCL